MLSVKFTSAMIPTSFYNQTLLIKFVSLIETQAQIKFTKSPSGGKLATCQPNLLENIQYLGDSLQLHFELLNQKECKYIEILDKQQVDLLGLQIFVIMKKLPYQRRVYKIQTDKDIILQSTNTKQFINAGFSGITEVIDCNYDLSQFELLGKTSNQVELLYNDLPYSIEQIPNINHLKYNKIGKVSEPPENLKMLSKTVGQHNNHYWYIPDSYAKFNKFQKYEISKLFSVNNYVDLYSKLAQNSIQTTPYIKFFNQYHTLYNGKINPLLASNILQNNISTLETIYILLIFTTNYSEIPLNFNEINAKFNEINKNSSQIHDSLLLLNITQKNITIWQKFFSLTNNFTFHLPKSYVEPVLKLLNLTSIDEISSLEHTFTSLIEFLQKNTYGVKIDQNVILAKFTAQTPQNQQIFNKFQLLQPKLIEFITYETTVQSKFYINFNIQQYKKISKIPNLPIEIDSIIEQFLVKFTDKFVNFEEKLTLKINNSPFSKQLKSPNFTFNYKVQFLLFLMEFGEEMTEKYEIGAEKAGNCQFLQLILTGSRICVNEVIGEFEVCWLVQEVRNVLGVEFEALRVEIEDFEVLGVFLREFEAGILSQNSYRVFIEGVDCLVGFAYKGIGLQEQVFIEGYLAEKYVEVQAGEFEFGRQFEIQFIQQLDEMLSSVLADVQGSCLEQVLKCKIRLGQVQAVGAVQKSNFHIKSQYILFLISLFNFDFIFKIDDLSVENMKKQTNINIDQLITENIGQKEFQNIFSQIMDQNHIKMNFEDIQFQNYQIELDEQQKLYLHYLLKQDIFSQGLVNYLFAIINKIINIDFSLSDNQIKQVQKDLNVLLNTEVNIGENYQLYLIEIVNDNLDILQSQVLSGQYHKINADKFQTNLQQLFVTLNLENTYVHTQISIILALAYIKHQSSSRNVTKVNSFQRQHQQQLPIIKQNTPKLDITDEVNFIIKISVINNSQKLLRYFQNRNFESITLENNISINENIQIIHDKCFYINITEYQYQFICILLMTIFNIKINILQNKNLKFSFILEQYLTLDMQLTIAANLQDYYGDNVEVSDDYQTKAQNLFPELLSSLNKNSQILIYTLSEYISEYKFPSIFKTNTTLNFQTQVKNFITSNNICYNMAQQKARKTSIFFATFLHYTFLNNVIDESVNQYLSQFIGATKQTNLKFMDITGLPYIQIAHPMIKKSQKYLPNDIIYDYKRLKFDDYGRAVIMKNVVNTNEQLTMKIHGIK